jgi:hypothetical protein
VGLAVTLGAAVELISLSALGQYRSPVVERKTPRAVAVLETYKNGSRRLIPVTYYFEKKYYDAGLYHATPVPFTLYSETVYDVLQLGVPLGTFTVRSATERQSAWWGNGRFKGMPDPVLMAKKKVAPVVLEDPSKPVLHRREGSEGDNPAPRPSAASGGATEAPEDPDRPKLHRKQGSEGDATAAGAGQGAPAAQAPTAGAPSSQPSSQTTQTAQTEESSQQDPDRPKLHRRDDSGSQQSGSAQQPGSTQSTSTPAAQPNAKGAQSAALVTVGAVERTPSDDPDHPILRRGKPVQEQSGRDLPDFKVDEEPVTRLVAVSDASPTEEPQPLIYACPPEERDRLETQARELALAELQRMGAHRGLAMAAAKPVDERSKAGAKSTAAAKAKAAKNPMADWKPADEQFVPFDLEYNNYATVVYSARYTAPAAADVKPKSWVVTVIGREDEGKLVKLYSAVSDPRELGLYPEVRLVDTVDPDGYGRFALLFREKKRDGVSWLLGRVNGYEMQTVFETAGR